MPAGGDPNIRKCRGCGHAMFWAVTEKGKKITVNPYPVANGNVIIEPANDPRLEHTAIILPKLAGPDERRRAVWQSHFATCAQAESFRKPKPGTLR